MLSHTAASFKRGGTVQIFLGVLSFVWQIGILICTSQENIYQEKQSYARDISYSSTGFFSGLVFIASGLVSCKCCKKINDPTTGDPTTTIRAAKGLDFASIAIAILETVFNAYLAYLTSHWYTGADGLNTETIQLAHAALPLHVLECLTAIVEIIVAALELRLHPITKPLPPVSYKVPGSTGASGLENPAYATNADGIN